MKRPQMRYNPIMGFDISFVTKNDTEPHEPIPEDFEERYRFRYSFSSILMDMETESIRQCDCSEKKHDYFCDEPEAQRPKDFTEFRTRLKSAGILENEMCVRWVEFLERNPNVFFTFSN